MESIIASLGHDAGPQSRSADHGQVTIHPYVTRQRTPPNGNAPCAYLQFMNVLSLCCVHSFISISLALSSSLFYASETLFYTKVCGHSHGNGSRSLFLVEWVV